MSLEYKQFEFECKALPDKDDGFFRFEGALSTYGNVDSYGDIIEAGAFTKGLAKVTPSLLWQHRMNEPVGVWEDINDTPKKLHVVGKMPREDTLVSGRIIPQIKVGSVRSMSVGMSLEEWEYDKKNRRVIKDATAWEGSLVTIPANIKATITGFKSMFDIEDMEQIRTERDLEKLLRDSGAFSRKAVAFIMAKIDKGRLKSESSDVSYCAISSAVDEIKKLTNELKGI